MANKKFLQNEPRLAIVRLNSWLVLLICLIVVVLVKLQPFLGFRISLTQQVNIFLTFIFCVQVRWWIFRRWGWISGFELAVANWLAQTDAWERRSHLWVLNAIAGISNLRKPPTKSANFSNNDFKDDRLNTKKLCLFTAVLTIPLSFLEFSYFRHDARRVLYPLGNVFVMGMLIGLSKSEQKSAEKAQRGAEGEERIASLLLPFVQQQGGTLYSRLHENRLRISGMGDLDILLTMPSNKNFAISVKVLEGVEGQKIKVFYDPVAQALRYRKGREGKQKFEAEPTLALQERIKWLLANVRDLLIQPSTMLVVFPSPVVVQKHKDSPTVTVGEQSFVFLNGVYVVMQQDLVQLLSDLLNQGERISSV